MADPSQKPHSHPICPTCQSDLSGRKDLEYFAKTAPYPLAAAGPRAAAQHTADLGEAPEWVQWLSCLGEELTDEAIRRLDLVRDAGLSWENRAKTVTASEQSAGKEVEGTPGSPSGRRSE
jgi:hypothetical protein